jgi:predicted flap endonuclease-1-like 5' DNA nuclease
MATKVIDIEGVGPAYASRLEAAGVKTAEELLARAADPKGRASLATTAGIAEGLILKWVNHSDLMRINGIGPQYAELLEAAGVDTVKELRGRNAENLAGKLIELNAARKLSGAAPTVAMITAWITEAKTLDPRVSH